MVGNLTCMGLSHALNVSERLDLRWKVSGAPQLSATVRGFVAGTDAFCYFVEGNSRHLNTQAELMPAAEYTWMVEIQTERGVYRSSPARFRTASGKFDSRAKWISDGRRFLSHDDGEKSPVLALTKKFRLEEVPQTAAIADICGLGLYEFYLNGRRVGDRVLDPAFTDYTRRCLYATYDVSVSSVREKIRSKSSWATAGTIRPRAIHGDSILRPGVIILNCSFSCDAGVFACFLTRAGR